MSTDYPEAAGPGYPRVYRIQPSARRWIRVTAVTLVAVGVYGTAGQLLGWVRRTMSPAGFIAVNGFFAVLAVSLWLKTNRYVTLDQDQISVTTWRGTRTMRRDRIGGHRMIFVGRARITPVMVLDPLDPGERPMRLPPWLDGDHVLQHWISTLPRSGR
jgi:hypothetical protein